MNSLFIIKMGAILFFTSAAVISCNNNEHHNGDDSTLDSNGLANNSYDSAQNLNETKFSTSKGKQNNAQYLMTAYTGGFYEIEASRLALKKSSDKNVKELAGFMIKAHTQLNDEIKDLAGKKRFSLPGNIDETHQKLLNTLQSVKGPAFDADYLRQMVNDHKDAIILLNQAAKCNDNSIINWANLTLPKIQKHLDLVNACQAKIDSSTKKQEN